MALGLTSLGSIDDLRLVIEGKISELNQRVKSEVISIPLHIVSLHTELVSGPIMVGAMISLPVEGISVILGNDLVGNRVMTDPCMCSTPRLSTESEESKLQ